MRLGRRGCVFVTNDNFLSFVRALGPHTRITRGRAFYGADIASVIQGAYSGYRLRSKPSAIVWVLISRVTAVLGFGGLLPA
jgi:hypothetical protein